MEKEVEQEAVEKVEGHFLSCLQSSAETTVPSQPTQLLLSDQY